MKNHIKILFFTVSAVFTLYAHNILLDIFYEHVNNSSNEDHMIFGKVFWFSLFLCQKVFIVFVFSVFASYVVASSDVLYNNIGKYLKPYKQKDLKIFVQSDVELIKSLLFYFFSLTALILLLWMN